MKKNLKFWFSEKKKWLQTILIKFCGFIVHLKPNNMTLAAFPEKIPETEKKLNYSVWPSPNGAPNPTDQSHTISISRAPLQPPVTI